MLKLENRMPLDYSLCCMTVTVYHREGLTRQVVKGCHLEFGEEETETCGLASRKRPFLLVVPGEADIAPGDKIFPGIGPETPGECLTVSSVKRRHFMGRVCHTEVRG